MTKPSKHKSVTSLKKILAGIDDLKLKSVYSPEIATTYHPEFVIWLRRARAAIRYAFGDQSTQLRDFDGVEYARPFGFDEELTSASDSDYYFGGLDMAAAIVRSMIDEIEEYWEDDDNAPVTDSATTDRSQQAVISRRIFVVHGRDEGAKESVARFLEKVGLEPVILSELPGKGQTIIEKFESNSDVGFAVAILTPDDAGSLSDETELKARARQNVIFELGFFIGKLGRDRVCALTKGKPDIPSDYAGVEYIPLDDRGAWRMGLFKELRAAGFNIDADRLVGA